MPLIRRHLRIGSTLAGVLLTASLAGAHDVRFHESGEATNVVRNWRELAGAWEFDPFVVITLIVSAVFYALGTWRMWNAAGRGHGLRNKDVCCFALGWWSLVIALISPLHRWGTVLFSAHMSQHEILMLVSAPLLVMGRPIVAFLKAIPARWSRRLASWAGTPWWSGTWQLLTNAFVAWLIHAATLWIWHLPTLFDAANRNEAVHAFQHISFLVSALLFWWALIQAPQRVAGFGVGVLYMLTTAIHSGLLGALITFASGVWYPSYLTRTQSWGLTPLEDQQLGGLIMWIPACTVYIVAGLMLLLAWMQASGERVKRWETEMFSSCGNSDRPRSAEVLS
jgi:putative membrane protein